MLCAVGGMFHKDGLDHFKGVLVFFGEIDVPCTEQAKQQGECNGEVWKICENNVLFQHNSNILDSGQQGGGTIIFKDSEDTNLEYSCQTVIWISFLIKT